MITSELLRPAPAAPAAPLDMAEVPLPDHESHTSISTYRECPLRYAFRYVERRPGHVRPERFAFGKAVHHALETFVRARISARMGAGPEPTPEALGAAFDEGLAPFGLQQSETAEARQRAIPILVAFLAHLKALQAEPLAVELGFGLSIPHATSEEELRFVGYLDRVDRTRDGSIEVIDYKTGRFRTQADVDADPQVTAYAYASARGALRDPETGQTLPTVSRLGLYFVESNALVWTTRSDEQLATFEVDLVATVDRIRERTFPARPAPRRCDWCEYRDECGSAIRNGG